MKMVSVRATTRLVWLTSLLGATLAHAAGYTVQDLGEGSTIDLNNRGEVLLVNATGHTALWSNGTIAQISSMSGIKLNGQGAVLGITTQSTSDPRYPKQSIVFRAPDGTITAITDISPIAASDSAAIALTEDNRAVVQAFNQTLLWSLQNPAGIPLHTSPSSPDYQLNVQSFNTTGTVVGDATESAKTQLGYKIVHVVGTTNANASDPGLVTVSNYLGFSPKVVNDAGQVIGTKDVFNAKQALIATKAYFWSKATGEKSIPSLFLSTTTVPLDINTNGQVVGWAQPWSMSSSTPSDNLPTTVGIVWSAKTGTQNLNNLIGTASSGIRVLFATAVNASGQIAADGAIDGKRHALLLTPAP